MNDLDFMKLALDEAFKARDLDEVPVGAIVVRDGQVISRAHNLRETEQSPLAHAEILAIEKAAQVLGTWRLSDCDLYVTLEPCVMCSGALVQSRIRKLVFGATDPKGGGTKSLYQIPEDERLNHRLEVLGGVMAAECGEILSAFFRAKRSKR